MLLFGHKFEPSAILADPNDDINLLVYADWLEEQDDPGSLPRAEFLRLTVERS